MQTDPAPLKTAILDALAGSSSQKPVDVTKLYKLGDKADVEAALLGMYRSREVYCCLHIRKGNETSVWWLSGGNSAPVGGNKKARSHHKKIKGVA